MPGRLKIRILAGRHLPIMDRASESTDAFVEVKFGSLVSKTDVCSKSLNPMWNSDWFKFEVNDELLQDEPLQVRVLDHDTYSAHDAIGKVYIDIDPLLNSDSSHFLGGWFPIYDTMHGIRGEILLVVKLELFADINQFKQTSCGFKFICGTSIPDCYQVEAVHGFISDLIIYEDPEYKWIEKLRTPRASNEARQRVFMKMSGELQRRIGSKVEAIGGNAVIGYYQSYDLEGDSGITVRGIGTAVSIKTKEKVRIPTDNILSDSFKRSQSVPYTSSEKCSIHQSHVGVKMKSNANVFHQVSDFPFYTLTTFPRGILNRVSSVVCARSVKLLEKVNNQEDWETRELWWYELRQEINSHCAALSCNAVLGYREFASICDDVIILSAEGTAAEIDVELFESISREDIIEKPSTSSQNDRANRSDEAHLFRTYVESGDCGYPLSYRPSPLDGNINVPDILFCTLDIPNNVGCIGKGTLVQVRFCRKLKKSQSESLALHVSELLPFIEYELHRRLLIKVKIRGMNTLFRYQSSMTLGENLIVGVVSGTAIRVAALPHSNSMELGKILSDDVKEEYANFFEESIKKFQLEEIVNQTPIHPHFDATAKSHSGQNFPQKQSVYIELSQGGSDDINWMKESLPPPSCFVSNLDSCPGVEGFHEQSFFSLRRVRYDDDAEDEMLNRGLSNAFIQSINSLWFRKRRKNSVCSLSSIQFHVSLPDDDELQIWIIGSVLIPNGKSNGDSSISNRGSAPPHSGDFTFLKQSSHDRLSSEVEFDATNRTFEELKLSSSSFLRHRLSPFFNRLLKHSIPPVNRSRYNSTSSNRCRLQSESSSASDFDFIDINRVSALVDIATTSHIPGRPLKRHIGVLNLFIVRETSAVRGAEEQLLMAEPEHGTGSSWFVMRTLAESQALIRSHVLALGGNALASYRTSYVTLKESLAKNEAQCLLHVIGDVIEVV